jgi:deoxyribonuclease-4
VQIFVRNARGWRGRAYSQREIETFRTLLTENRIAPLIVHSCYLVNLASSNAALLAKSRAAVADDMRRAAMLGSATVTAHTGHDMGAGTAAGIRILAESVRLLATEAPPGMELLLENSARRTQLGGDWEHFAQLLNELDGEPRLGFCFDTCHAHAAGYRLDGARWVARTLGEFDAVLGLARLRLIHLNDSRGEAGGSWDRHAPIGAGTIGDAGFRAFLRRRWLRGRCAILETPIAHPSDDARNIAHARELMTGNRAKPRIRHSSARAANVAWRQDPSLRSG